MLNLLIHLKIEQEAMRNIIAGHIVESAATPIEELSSEYSKDRQDGKKPGSFQLTSHYSIEDTGDDLFGFVMT